MKKLFIALLLGAAISHAQIPTPAIPPTGNIGPAGIFPQLNSGTLQFTSDANHTMTYPEMSAYVIKVTSSTSLTATRNLIAPLTIGFAFVIDNATTGGQAIQVIGISGSGVSIPNGSAMLVVSDGSNYVSAGTSGGGGGSPGGNVGDVQTNAGGSFGGTAGVFGYSPTSQTVSLTQRFGSTPGYNVGGAAGATTWQAIAMNNAIKYSQGNISYWASNKLQCFASGDCNFFDMYGHDNAPCNDANCESGTWIRNYIFLADPAYTATITGTSMSNTRVAMSSATNDNFGNGRTAIVQEAGQSLAVTGATPQTLGGHSYV